MNAKVGTAPSAKSYPSTTSEPLWRHQGWWMSEPAFLKAVAETETKPSILRLTCNTLSPPAPSLPKASFEVLMLALLKELETHAHLTSFRHCSIWRWVSQVEGNPTIWNPWHNDKSSHSWQFLHSAQVVELVYFIPLVKTRCEQNI